MQIIKAVANDQHLCGLLSFLPLTYEAPDPAYSFLPRLGFKGRRRTGSIAPSGGEPSLIVQSVSPPLFCSSWYFPVAVSRSSTLRST
jgi:hypothetical protein